MGLHDPWPEAATIGERQIFRTRIFIVSFHDLSIDAYDKVLEVYVW